MSDVVWFPVADLCVEMGRCAMGFEVRYSFAQRLNND